MPLNDSGKEITEDDDIFIDDPKQLVSLDPSFSAQSPPRVSASYAGQDLCKLIYLTQNSD